MYVLVKERRPAFEGSYNKKGQHGLVNRIVVEVVVLPNSFFDLRLLERVVFVRDVLALAVLFDFLRNIGASVEPTFE